jgi:hypothetical protein
MREIRKSGCVSGLPGSALKMAKRPAIYGCDLALDNVNKLEVEGCAQ